MMLDMYSEYAKFFENLKKNGRLSRFGKVFQAADNYYFFDTGTGKVLECDKCEFEILTLLTERNSTEFDTLTLDEEQFKQAINNIMESIEKENIFKAEPLIEFDGGHFRDLSTLIPQNMQQVLLEVTDACNLRCKYCIYHQENNKFREFGNRYMNIETAYKALDYALKNSYMPELYVGFYGGEPLLNFEFIQNCVDYVIANKGDKEITFSMTTNGTLITKNIAEYLASVPNFNVTVSVDGDEEIHNENRIFRNGEGSFASTLRGINYLKEAYGGDKRYHLSLSSVVSPPYTNEKFDRIQKFYRESCKGFQTNTTYVELPEKEKQPSIKNEKMENVMPLLLWDKQKEVPDRRDSFTSSMNISVLSRIHKRVLTNEPNKVVSLNGCCIPGVRRLYVDVEGNYLPCERVGNAPFLGDVYRGLDFEAIKKYYVDDYVKKSLPDCNQCWALPLCGVCYSHCYNSDGLDIQRKRKTCEEVRYTMNQYLIYYHELLKSDPDFINEINELVVG